MTATEAASINQAAQVDYSSPAALCKSILDAVEHPDLGKYLQANSSVGNENKTDALGRFQSSDEFAAFSKEMLQCLNNLQTGQFGGEYCGSYNELTTRLELTDKRAGSAFYGPTLFDMYCFGCLHLKQAVAMLKFAQSSPKDVPLEALKDSRPIIKSMEGELLACGPGLLQKTSTLLTTLQHTIFPPKLVEQIDHLRLQTAQQYLGQAMSEIFANDPFLESSHIHMVKTWMQVLAPQLGIKADRFDDIYANKNEYFNEVPYLQRNKITNELKALITDSNLVNVIAQSTLEEVRHNLALLSQAERKDFSGAINKVTQPLKSRFGELKEGALFKELELGEELPQVSSNPALLVAELHNKMVKEIEPKTSPDLKVQKIALNDSTNQFLCGWGNALWIETENEHGTERALVCFDEMSVNTAESIVKQLGSKSAHTPTVEVFLKDRLLKDLFLKELFLNHADFNQCFPHSAIAGPEALTIALLCAYSNHKEASAFRVVFDSVSVSKSLKPEQLFKAIRQSRLTLEQIDTALTNIHDNKEKLIGNRDKFSWKDLQINLMLEEELSVDEQVFRLVMGKTRPDRSILLNVTASTAGFGWTEWLKLLIDAPDYSVEEKAQLAKDTLKKVDVSQLRAEALSCLLSFNPVLKQEGPHDINVLKHFLSENAPDELTSLVAKACQHQEWTDFRDDFGRTPLMFAAGLHLPETVKALIDNPAVDRTITGNLGENALLTAVKTAVFSMKLNEEQFLETCETLLNAGFSANDTATHGNSTLLYALKGNFNYDLEVSLVRLLVEKGALDITDDKGYNAISIACHNVRPQTIKALLASENFTLHKDTLHHLFSAAELPSRGSMMESRFSIAIRKMNIFTLLLEQGLSIDTKNNDGKTPIDIAIENNQVDFAMAVLAIDPNLDSLDHSGYTRLHHAVINKKHELVKVLVEAGANINTKSGGQHSNQTALAFATRNEDEKMVSLLISLGA